MALMVSIYFGSSGFSVGNVHYHLVFIHHEDHEGHEGFYHSNIKNPCLS
jgi:hypothetical protein